VLINLVDRIGEYIVQQTRHWQTVESFTTGSIEYNCTPYGVPSVNRLTSLAPWPTIRSLNWFAAFRHRKAISNLLGVDEIDFWCSIAALTLLEQEFARLSLNSLNRPRKTADIDRNHTWTCYSGMVVFSEASVCMHEGFAGKGSNTLRGAELADPKKLDYFQRFCHYHIERCILRDNADLIKTGPFLREWCAKISAMDLTHWRYRGLLSESLSDLALDLPIELLRRLIEDKECLSEWCTTNLGLHIEARKEGQPEPDDFRELLEVLNS